MMFLFRRSYLLFYALLIMLPNLSFSQTWNYRLMYVKAGTAAVYETATEESFKKGTVYYLDKVLILDDSEANIMFGWDRILYPFNGYVKSDNLISPTQKKLLDIKFENKTDDMDKYSSWLPHIKPCVNEYLFVQSSPDLTSNVVGAIKENEEVLYVTSEDDAHGIWMKVLFPYYGYVKSSGLDLTERIPIISLGLQYGAYNIPYEKNLKNYFNPIGGFVEYTKSSWLFSIGLGYFRSEQRIEDYFLKTNLFELYGKLNFLKLFNNKLETYALFGAAYWMSTFQNTKYPSLSEYFPLEKDSGPAFLAGGGINYYPGNFIFGVQYIYWNSLENAVFGTDPVPGSFKTQYKLFTGLNQVNVMLGYRIIIN